MTGTITAVLLSTAALAEDDPNKQAASDRLSSVVNSCFSQAGSIGGGRVELDAQAHDGELVNLMFSSELGNGDFEECLCRRAPGALAVWSGQVEGGDLLALPFILGSVVTTNAESIECALELEAEEGDGEALDQLLIPHLGELEGSKVPDPLEVRDRGGAPHGGPGPRDEVHGAAQSGALVARPDVAAPLSARSLQDGALLRSLTKYRP